VTLDISYAYYFSFFLFAKLIQTPPSLPTSLSQMKTGKPRTLLCNAKRMTSTIPCEEAKNGD